MSSTTPRDSWSLEQGDQVGRYRIITRIADGGMATVYLAELAGPAAFAKRVALKVIHQNLMNEPSFVGMFVDEARIAALLDHPNIVQTFDFVQEEGVLAIAMEYAPGLPACVLLSSDVESLDLDVEPELVAYVGAEAAAALHYAHTLVDTHGLPLGIVHRDVAATNIQIGFDGRVRLVDFGIARARDRLSSTVPGRIMGTLAYVAPERFDGAAPTPQSDVWSLGVVLWELLAQRRLFRRATDIETAVAVKQDPIPPFEMLREDVPPALAFAIEGALQRDPASRWASAVQLEQKLREVLPANLDAVREPLLCALAPRQEDHLASLRAALDRDAAAAVPVVVEEPERDPAEPDVVRIVVEQLSRDDTERDADVALGDRQSGLDASVTVEPRPSSQAPVEGHPRRRGRNFAMAGVMLASAIVSAIVVVLALDEWGLASARDETSREHLALASATVGAGAHDPDPPAGPSGPVAVAEPPAVGTPTEGSPVADEPDTLGLEPPSSPREPSRRRPRARRLRNGQLVFETNLYRRRPKAGR